MSQKFKYVMDKGGVTAILKSSGVKAELARMAEEKTAQANALLRAHGTSSSSHEYMHHGHDLTYTSIESVHTTGKTTEFDHAKHRTLNAINH